MGLIFIEKKGESVLHHSIIFIILNLIFFSLLIYFVYDSSQGEIVYEEAYAKQIANLIDGSEPNSLIEIPFDKAIELANANNKDLSKVLSISDNKVFLSFSGKKGYEYEFFSDYSVKSYFSGNMLLLEVKFLDG